MLRWASRWSSLLLLLIGSLHASAASFTDIFVFGDSLSDSGNVFAATGGVLPPDPPYFQGRFSDGPIWVERLGQLLGLEIVANGSDLQVVQGNNFAVGAARAGIDVPAFPLGTIPSTLTQVRAFLDASAPVQPTALYVVYAGSADLLVAAGSQQGDPAGPPPSEVVEQAAAAIATAVSELSQAGARHILLPNVADLGLTPRSRFVEQNAALASELTGRFNAALDAELTNLQTDRDTILHRLDVYGLANAVVEDARDNGGSRFGIVNVDRPIFEGFAGSSGADPSTSLFADDIHISAAGHRLLGEAALTVVPEPGCWALALTGLICLVARGTLATGSYGNRRRVVTATCSRLRPVRARQRATFPPNVSPTGVPQQANRLRQLLAAWEQDVQPARKRPGS